MKPPNKISTLIKNKFVQSSLHIKFSWFQYPQNSNQNSFINATSYIHHQISGVINIVQISPCQITQQFKNAPRANKNEMTMSQHQVLNKTWNQFANKETKKMSPPWSLFWSVEHGSWILEEPFFLIPFKWWVIFFPIKSKKRRPIGRCHCQCKKNEGLEMGFKKWVCSKDGQEH